MNNCRCVVSDGLDPEPSTKFVGDRWCTNTPQALLFAVHDSSSVVDYVSVRITDYPDSR